MTRLTRFWRSIMHHLWGDNFIPPARSQGIASHLEESSRHGCEL